MFIKWLQRKSGSRAPQAPAVELNSSGLYEVKDPAAVAVHVLESAVPPEGKSAGKEASEPTEYPKYAWLRGGVAAPSSQDFYIIKLSGPCEFTLLAYVDAYQRAFHTFEPELIPPAKWPDLTFDRGVEEGCVNLFTEAGSGCTVAEFRVDGERYSLDDSWYDFGPFREGLCVEEAVSRAFLAFVYRPRIYGSKRPLRGIGLVEDVLKPQQLLESLNRIASLVQAAEDDAAQKPPAILVLFVRMLIEAGLPSALAAEREAGYCQVSMVQPKQKGTLSYLCAEEGCVVSERALWQIESAYNHFCLMRELLGVRAAKANMEECQKLADLLPTFVALQSPHAELPCDLNAPVFAKDWDVRVGLGKAMEHYFLPFRFAAEFKADIDSGEILFKAVSPDAQMMPRWAWGEGALRQLSLDERKRLSLGYAMRVSALLAASAFHQSRGVRRVTLALSYFFDQGEEGEGLPESRQTDLDFTVTFGREQFEDRAAYTAQVESDPEAFCRDALSFAMGAQESGQWRLEDLSEPQAQHESAEVDAVAVVDSLAAQKDRALRTDVIDRPLGMASSVALGCRSFKNMRINYDAAQKYHAQCIAKSLSSCESLQEGVKSVRALQDATDDPKVFAACNRVMEQLALGEVGMDDGSRIISLFVGDDPYLDALSRSRAISLDLEGDVDLAISILKSVVDEAEDAGVFTDDEALVYRVFDSSAGRVIYNLAREGISGASGLDLQEDRGKEVELAPDSYLFCNLELVRLLEKTFDRTEDALTYGHIALRLAPTMVVGYRSLARVYMLMGDLSSARELLCQALRFAVHPNDLGLLYYQLGYVEWKSGRLRTAVACYLRAIGESSALRVQASTELRELLGEDGARMMDIAQVTPVLRSSHVPVAPNADILACLLSAAEAAVNEGMYPAARNMLSLRLHHFPDESLSHVLRSLE